MTKTDDQRGLFPGSLEMMILRMLQGILRVLAPVQS